MADPATAAATTTPAPASEASAPEAAAAATAPTPTPATTSASEPAAAPTTTEAPAPAPAAAAPAAKEKPPAGAPSLPTEDVALQIPRAAVKRIMKLDPDTKQLSQDAIVLVGKATELFVDKLARASQKMAVANRRKTIKYEDIADARVSDKHMEFLDGVIPQV